jgi:hypothetical protein
MFGRNISPMISDSNLPVAEPANTAVALTKLSPRAANGRPPSPKHGSATIPQGIAALVRKVVSEQPNVPAADQALHALRSAGDAETAPDPAAILSAVRKERARLASERLNRAAREAEAALPPAQMDQVLRLLHRLAPADGDAGPRPDINWEAVLVDHAGQLPAGLAARPGASTMLSHLASDLRRGKRPGHAARARLSESQLAAVHAALAAARGGVAGPRSATHARVASGAWEAVERLPWAASAALSRHELQLLARDWARRSRGDAASP